MQDSDYYLEDENVDARIELVQEAASLEEVSVEELLISMVMARPPLWDSRLPLKERSKTIRDNLWLEIYMEFGEQERFSVTTLIKKWRNLRDTYVRLKGENESYVPSGSGAVKRKKNWQYYDMMSFLNDTVSYRPTVSNLSLSSSRPASSEKGVDQPASSTAGPSSAASSPGICTPTAKRKRSESKTVEWALVDAINKVNAPVAAPTSINPICQKISEMLSKMPLRERTELEIELLQRTFSVASDYF